jgi:hypothetical protein
MPEPHKRANRHPKDKMAYRVNNWCEYDQALRHRGDITLWLSQDTTAAWMAPKTGKRGAQPLSSDIAIETALTFRWLFRLPLRQTEGFLSSIVTLLGVSLPCPDHTTLSRRNATVEMRQQVERAPQGPIALIIDSSGLKVCGQGEWHAQKHGEKQHKRWKNLHIGVDAQGQIVAATVTESHEQDPSPVPELLSQIEREIERFIGDGMYDKELAYAAVAQPSPGAQVIIPPRKDAVLSHAGTISPTPRDQHLLAIERAGRFQWKRTSGYYAQSHAENAFSRFKRTFGGGLRATQEESQEREAALACALLNRMLALGRPQSYLVS